MRDEILGRRKRTSSKESDQRQRRLAELDNEIESQGGRYVTVRRPAPNRELNDCVVVATAAYSKLKPNAYWVRMAGFGLNSKNELGHVVVLYQPTAASKIWLYDKTDSFELQTRSQNLAELTKAITQCLNVGNQVSDIRWVD